MRVLKHVLICLRSLAGLWTVPSPAPACNPLEWSDGPIEATFAEWGAAFEAAMREPRGVWMAHCGGRSVLRIGALEDVLRGNAAVTLIGPRMMDLAARCGLCGNKKRITCDFCG